MDSLEKTYKDSNLFLTGNAKKNIESIIAESFIKPIVISINSDKYDCFENDLVLVKDKYSAETALSKLCDEIDRRCEVLFNNECMNFKEYEGDDMPIQKVVIDEIQSLEKSWCINMLSRILGKGRVVGVQVIVYSDYPYYRYAGQLNFLSNFDVKAHY